MSYAEIAAEWGIASGTVGATISQAMQKLRLCLQDLGLTGRSLH